MVQLKLSFPTATVPINPNKPQVSGGSNQHPGQPTKNFLSSWSAIG
jgi:hypothetical protein